MIESTHHSFINKDWLQSLSDELLNANGWVFRQKFWRYYLAQGLQPYVESNAATWYHNQTDALYTMTSQWRKLFDKVYDLAGSNFQLMRYALTGQTQNQQPVLHTDVSENLNGCYKSYLIYLNNVATQGSTDFVVDNKLIHQEPPEPGKLIVFDSKILHCGNPPTQPDFLRLSIVLHGIHT
jgi:hypothetical protein